MPYAVLAKLGKRDKRFGRWDFKVYKTKAEAQKAMQKAKTKTKNIRGAHKPIFKVAYVKGPIGGRRG